jgi:hypothetical protein
MKQGNMYDWCVPWNPLAGECPHKCVYCSTKSLMFRPACKKKYSGELRLDEAEQMLKLVNQLNREILGDKAMECVSCHSIKHVNDFATPDECNDCFL